MSEKSKNSKSETCTVKRCKKYLTKPLYHIFETLWAIGAGVMATVVTPLLLIEKGSSVTIPFSFDLIRSTKPVFPDYQTR